MRQKAEVTKDKNPFEGWTTVEDAADIISRDATVLRYWIKRGFITAHQVGKRVRLVNIEEVKAYSARHEAHSRQKSAP